MHCPRKVANRDWEGFGVGRTRGSPLWEAWGSWSLAGGGPFTTGWDFLGGEAVELVGRPPCFSAGPGDPAGRSSQSPL